MNIYKALWLVAELAATVRRRRGQVQICAENTKVK